jgi:hypothetical protein
MVLTSSSGDVTFLLKKMILGSMNWITLTKLQLYVNRWMTGKNYE